MAMQKCPVCEGRGTVPLGFYDDYDRSSTTNGARPTCKACGGRGIVFSPDPVPQGGPIERWGWPRTTDGSVVVHVPHDPNTIVVNFDEHTIARKAATLMAEGLTNAIERKRAEL